MCFYIAFVFQRLCQSTTTVIKSAYGEDQNFHESMVRNVDLDEERMMKMPQRYFFLILPHSLFLCRVSSSQCHSGRFKHFFIPVHHQETGHWLEFVIPLISLQSVPRFVHQLFSLLNMSKPLPFCDVACPYDLFFHIPFFFVARGQG